MTDLTATHTDASGQPEAQRRTADQTARRGLYIWLALGIPWGALITALAIGGAFEPLPGAMPLGVAGAAILPALVVLAAYRISPGFRRWVTALSATDLTAFQGWRVLGVTFVVLWWFGHLPLIFALLAGLGDVAIGIAAPFVTGKLRRGDAGAIRSAYLLIIFGLLDFVVAIGSGGLSSPGNLLASTGSVSAIATVQFPLVLIPAFLVPNFAILHVLTWLRLRQNA